MPQSTGGQRAFAAKDLPPSVEAAYYKKCIELRRRINDIEENNDGTRLRIKRLNRGITKMRLERAFLLEQLSRHMEYNPDDSDRSSSPPPTPTDKPLRSKRSHRQKTPPNQSGGQPGQPSPGTLERGGLHHVMNAMHPMSSAQSTPDPSRHAPFFSTIPPPQAGSPQAPHAVNGTGAGQVLPPLHPSHLPPLQPQRAPEPASASPAVSRSAYYDPTHDDRAGNPENEAEYAGRRRAHSSAHAPPSPAQLRDAQAPNGDRPPNSTNDPDTEMGDAPGGGFTAVNR